MDFRKRLSLLLERIKNYRYVLAVLVLGVALMLIPSGNSASAETQEEPEMQHETGVEDALERVLGKIAGAGEVAVMLTMEQSEETQYQTDASGNGTDTVLIADTQRSQAGLVRTVYQQRWRGAIVVCQGADDPAVRLAIVEAVSRVTGLGYDKISVLKMQ